MNWLKRLLGSTSQTPVASPLTPDDKARALEEIEERVGRDVAAAFRTEAEIIEGVTEVVGDEFGAEVIKPLVIERTQYYFTKQQRDEKTWPAVTDCDRLDRAFSELESRGVVCRQDFSCCGNCGHGEIRGEMEDAQQKGQLVRGYAFYHEQDTERAVEGGGIFLAYGATEEGDAAMVRIAHEICDAVRAEGLKVEWDGTAEKRIQVGLDWKRRRAPRCVSSKR